VSLKVVYLNKPFISYQFDYDEFINSREEKPHCDIRSELPAYVVTTHNQLISTIQAIEKDNLHRAIKALNRIS
jgi:CDP-glycerol glycerophosphotransferase (TagB/SpsB family)